MVRTLPFRAVTPIAVKQLLDEADTLLVSRFLIVWSQFSIDYTISRENLSVTLSFTYR